jgi:hypothetical protein
MDTSAKKSNLGPMKKILYPEKIAAGMETMVATSKSLSEIRWRMYSKLAGTDIEPIFRYRTTLGWYQ